MAEHVILVSVPGLRRQDLQQMPRLRGLVSGGDCGELVPTFPCVTCPVQANMTTGMAPAEHGVVANGFYSRKSQEVEMWTSPNDCIHQPQLWDILSKHNPATRSAVWFPMHAKNCGAELVCMPAPIHNPDGTESLWCYTKPERLYQELLDELDHFPLQHFWGPMANIKSTSWIVESAVRVAQRERPNFFYLYLPHLDYAAQKYGPDSQEARQALVDLDEQFGKLIDGFSEAYQPRHMLWLVATEYVITPVDHVTYPNRILREAGLLAVRETDDGEHLDFPQSKAWALVDHQFSHVFVQDQDEVVIRRVAELFANEPGIAEVLRSEEQQRYELAHARCGELVLVSEPNSWQVYYWWLEDQRAPGFARTVDIHRKPGYDPVELFFDPASKSIPLDATLVQGSHGAPALSAEQRGILLSSERGVFVERPLADTDVADIVLRQFGI